MCVEAYHKRATVIDRRPQVAGVHTDTLVRAVSDTEHIHNGGIAEVWLSSTHKGVVGGVA